MAQSPAPAIAGGEMEPSFPGTASRRTRQAQQASGENPGRQRPLALVEEGVREVVAGTLAAVTPGAFAAGAGGVRAPRLHVLALASGPLQGPIFPPQRLAIGVTLIDVEEGVDRRAHRHG